MEGTARILVIDDDVRIRRQLGKYLSANGYSTSTVENGAKALRAHERQPFDLIILEVVLPGESGLDICRLIRVHDNVPIIILTALGDETNRIVGLEVGADDYVQKPYSPRELLGRIRAILRRTRLKRRERSDRHLCNFRFSFWALDVRARTLTRDCGSETQLSAADSRILELLLNERGRTVSRARLHKALRGRDRDTLDRSVDIRVCRLRQILGENARAPMIIKTVHGQGYAIGVEVTAY